MAQKQTTLIRSDSRSRLLRLSWLIVFFLFGSLVVAGIPYLYRQALGTPIVTYFQNGNDSALIITALDEAGISRPAFAAFQTIFDTLNVIPFFLFGFLIFWRRPGDHGALVISLLLILSSRVNSSALPVFNWIGATRLITLISSVSLISFFYLFPDGRFVPRWTRWAAVLFALVLTPDILFTESRLNVAMNRLISDGPLKWILFFLLFGSLIFAQLYRYRRVSGPIERLQTRWVVIGLLAIPIATFITNMLLPLLVPALSQISGESMRYYILMKLLIAQPLSMVLPIGMGISLLRYRLYDLDVIIRKTLVYSLVTGLLALVYFGGVLLLQGVFARLGTGRSPAALVLSTLLIAALFNPLRHKVQEAVDRRFYRKKYNAEGVLAAFSAQARDEVDIERISAALVGAVEETVQPVETSLWLRRVQRQPGLAQVPADRDLENRLG